MKEDASFGQWLMQRRHTLHVQWVELATRIGCAVVTLRKIEADERRPSRQMAERLADQIAIAPHEREQFIRAARGELSVDRLAVPTLTRTTLTNLPAPAMSLIGREREIADVCALLARRDVRLLTLTGAPGVGKTRLALEAASALRSAFADGVFFADLTPLTKADLVPQAIAQALQGGLSGGRALEERLSHSLRTKQVLLVLDTFEHVRGAAPLLTQLLAAAPQLKFLVTSRSALEVSGEHRFTLLPLSVPPPADTWQRSHAVVEAHTHYAAIALFVQRARAVAPDFALTDAHVPAVSEICRRLDGLPLAIELAAARMALFTPDELLTRIADRWVLLHSDARDVPARHSVMWRALDWSYGLLSPTEQLLLRRLSVFADGCSLESAQQVCNNDGAVGHDVVDGLAALLASSLLQRHEGCDGRSRFTLLETVRVYALEHLHASGEAPIIQQRHAAYYLQLAEEAAQAWDGPDEAAWLRRLVSVRPDLRAALRWALCTHDTALALRLNGALFPFWTTCSSLSEAREQVQAALALARSNSVPNMVAAEANVLNVAGYVAVETSEYPEAYAYFERGLLLYRALNDHRGWAWSLRGCALVHMRRNEHAAAELSLNESRRLCESSGDAWGEAWSLYALAFLRLAQGDLPQAQHALAHALVYLQQQRMTFGVFRTLLALGYTSFEQGDVAAAETRYREALALSQETPLLTFVTIALDGLGMVAAAWGLPLRVARLWGAAASLREATSEDRWPTFQRAYEHALAAARMEVGETEWSMAWAAGRTLTAEQALAEALANIDKTISVGA